MIDACVPVLVYSLGRHGEMNIASLSSLKTLVSCIIFFEYFLIESNCFLLAVGKDET